MIMDKVIKSNLYKKVDKKFNITRFLPIFAYLFWGVVTTLTNIFSYAILTKMLNINYMISNVISWILAVSVAYITNKIYVFSSKAKTIKAVIKELTLFFIARILTLGIDILLMFIGVSILKFDDMIIKAITQVVVIVVNYILSKLFVFNKDI